jgi:hypothetical protein
MHGALRIWQALGPQVPSAVCAINSETLYEHTILRPLGLGFRNSAIHAQFADSLVREQFVLPAITTAEGAEGAEGSEGSVSREATHQREK